MSRPRGATGIRKSVRAVARVLDAKRPASACRGKPSLAGRRGWGESDELLDITTECLHEIAAQAS